MWNPESFETTPEAVATSEMKAIDEHSGESYYYHLDREYRRQKVS